MIKPEAKLEEDFCNWCEAQGWLCLKLVNVSRRGFPDRTVIGPGWVAFVELKAPGGRLSQHQRETLGWLKDREQWCYVSDNLVALQNWLTTVSKLSSKLKYVDG